MMTQTQTMDGRQWVAVGYSVATSTTQRVERTFGRARGAQAAARAYAQEHRCAARLADDAEIARIDGQ